MHNARTPIGHPRPMPNASASRARLTPQRVAAAEEKRRRRMAKRATQAEMLAQAKVIWPHLHVIEKGIAERAVYLDGTA
jgi:hypothetical protein